MEKQTMSEVTWNPVRQLWETEQADLFSGQQEPYSETWPTSGMTRNGRLLPLPMSAHPTAGNECSSLLPTPKAHDGVFGTPTDERSSHREVNALADDRGSAPDSACVGRHEGRPEPARLERGFDAAVSGDGHGVDTPLLPTPVVTDALGARNSTAWRSNPDHNISIGDTLTDVMWKMAAERGEMELPTGPTQKQLLPTPTSRDHKGRNQRDDDTCLPGALIPTPNAQDGNGGKAPRGGRATHDTGTKRQVPLTDLPDLLPTEQTTHWGKYEPAIRRWEQLTPVSYTHLRAHET